MPRSRFDKINSRYKNQILNSQFLFALNSQFTILARVIFMIHNTEFSVLYISSKVSESLVNFLNEKRFNYDENNNDVTNST